MDEEQSASRDEIEEHMRKMNAAWRLYHYLEMEQPFSPSEARESVSSQFTAACYWLEAHGIRWCDLPYDALTKTFSLPGEDR